MEDFQACLVTTLRLSIIKDYGKIIYTFFAESHKSRKLSEQSFDKFST